MKIKLTQDTTVGKAGEVFEATPIEMNWVRVDTEPPVFLSPAQFEIIGTEDHQTNAAYPSGPEDVADRMNAKALADIVTAEYPAVMVLAVRPHTTYPGSPLNQEPAAPIGGAMVDVINMSTNRAGWVQFQNQEGEWVIVDSSIK